MATGRKFWIGRDFKTGFFHVGSKGRERVMQSPNHDEGSEDGESSLKLMKAESGEGLS